MGERGRIWYYRTAYKKRIIRGDYPAGDASDYSVALSYYTVARARNVVNLWYYCPYYIICIASYTTSPVMSTLWLFVTDAVNVQVKHDTQGSVDTEDAVEGWCAVRQHLPGPSQVSTLSLSSTVQEMHDSPACSWSGDILICEKG